MKNYFPDVVVAGFGRSGTTSMYRYLLSHPCVCGARKKETNILIENSSSEIKILDEYKKNFVGSIDGKIKIDCSPSYVLEPRLVSDLVCRLSSSAKIAFMIRDPVERMMSIYKGFVRSGKIYPNISFEKFVDISIGVVRGDVSSDKHWNEILLGEIERGKYINTVNVFAEIVGHDRVEVFLMNEMQNDPLEFMRHLMRRLDIPEFDYDDYKFNIENKGLSVRSTLLYNVAANLNSMFEPFLNKYPMFRVTLKSIHNKVNAYTNEESMAHKDLSLLSEYYNDSNVKLRDYLCNKYKERELPKWLLRM